MTESAAAIARAVRAREVSAVEVLDAHVAQIEEHDGRLNALVLPRLEQARAEAQRADVSEPRGPLHGVPFTAKDPFAAAGMRSPCGSRLLADHADDADCEPVRRLRAAGAILIGKTNVSEFCLYWDSTNVLFGSTHNPHDTSRTAGGSSGGEAAAVASGMSSLGLGSDMGGSIRNPAHFTGVFGLRPGRATVPLAGHHPLPVTAGVRLVASAGPLARTVEDLELGLSVLAPAVRPGEAVARIAVFEDDGLQLVSRACREAVRRAATALEDTGHAIVDERPPGQAEARAAYDAILRDELAVSLPAFVAGREDALSPYAADTLESLRGHEPSFERYVDAFHRIAVLEHAAAEWMARHPVALCPVAPDVAPPVGDGDWPPIDGQPARPGGKLSLCTYANALGLPAVAVPVMRSSEGLPVGVQLIGRRGSERTLLALAAELEAALGGCLAPGEGAPEGAVRLAAVDDAGTVGELLHAFASEFGDPTPGAEVLAGRAREALARRESVFLLTGDPPVGLAQLRFRMSVWSGRRDCYLEDLYVAPAQRGRGLGRALLERAMELARARGAGAMELATHQGDTAARGLYESAGFEYLEDGEPMLFYLRDL